MNGIRNFFAAALASGAIAGCGNGQGALEKPESADSGLPPPYVVLDRPELSEMSKPSVSNLVTLPGIEIDEEVKTALTEKIKQSFSGEEREILLNYIAVNDPLTFVHVDAINDYVRKLDYIQQLLLKAKRLGLADNAKCEETMKAFLTGRVGTRESVENAHRVLCDGMTGEQIDKLMDEPVTQKGKDQVEDEDGIVVVERIKPDPPRKLKVGTFLEAKPIESAKDAD